MTFFPSIAEANTTGQRYCNAVSFNNQNLRRACNGRFGTGTVIDNVERTVRRVLPRRK
ncbi:MAG: hypothetical protein ACRDBG_28335 [Waterburya sp.]